MNPVNVYDIVKTYLQTNGYDGLATVECGCWLDDLMPCLPAHEATQCVPGYEDAAGRFDSAFEPGEKLIRPGRRP